MVIMDSKFSVGFACLAFFASISFTLIVQYRLLTKPCATQRVGWWSPTVIRGDDCEAVLIPNHKFSVSVVRNLTQKTHWRIKAHIAINHCDVKKINVSIACFLFSNPSENVLHVCLVIGTGEIEKNAERNECRRFLTFCLYGTFREWYHPTNLVL